METKQVDTPYVLVRLSWKKTTQENTFWELHDLPKESYANVFRALEKWEVR